MEIDAGPFQSAYAYMTGYLVQLQEAISSVTPKSMDGAAHAMKEVEFWGGRVYVGGNGGSASISEHLGCDWIKREKPLKIHSLVSNGPALTMIANDYGYSETLVYQLKQAALTSRDLVILISSSGNSENIIRAAEYVKHKTPARLMGLTGFDGGKLRELSDISLYVQSRNYGVVEDCHQTLMHVLSQYHEK